MMSEVLIDKKFAQMTLQIFLKNPEYDMSINSNKNLYFLRLLENRYQFSN